jgi:hypothetical protein
VGHLIHHQLQQHHAKRQILQPLQRASSQSQQASLLTIHGLLTMHQRPEMALKVPLHTQLLSNLVLMQQMSHGFAQLLIQL